MEMENESPEPMSEAEVSIGSGLNEVEGPDRCLDPKPVPVPYKRRSRNWLATYQDFTSMWEPPAVFNTWVGLSVLSAATQRRVFLDEGNSKLYPNLFVVLVAPSGVGKTSAMREAVPFIEATGVAISPSTITAARLIQSIQAAVKMDDGGMVMPYVIWAEELPSFLGSDAYQSGLLAHLTAIYDCPVRWIKETKNKGIDTLDRPYPVMLAGTTAQGIFDVLPPGAASQGFTARLLFVHANYNATRTPEKPWTSMHEKLQAALVTDIKHIAELQGAMQLTEIAKTLWIDYYNYRPTPQDEFGDVRLQGYASRKPFYVKKLAMLLSVSESDRLVIEAHHIEQARTLLEDVDRGLREVYSEMAPSSVVQHYSKIVRKLKRKGGSMAHSELMRYFAYALDAREFREAMDALRDMGLVEQEATPQRMPSGVMRTALRYKLTTAGVKWTK